MTVVVEHSIPQVSTGTINREVVMVCNKTGRVLRSGWQEFMLLSERDFVRTTAMQDERINRDAKLEKFSTRDYGTATEAEDVAVLIESGRRFPQVMMISLMMALKPCLLVSATSAPERLFRLDSSTTETTLQMRNIGDMLNMAEIHRQAYWVYSISTATLILIDAETFDEF
ncbi:hypothetical protein SARC_05381 [Sphaeroforma arctica JP610]|uniref:Uncharacterized protein n=1 Tax=Sphaeroforma arctica JP610 TaxID=667725 RepID=A0A0L0FZR0_9EUKA|nr:hypothetical protein SARC_05381 [Sphaeroforma arctica JP610]KNC82342.1 hypothetical protein SARC_05381 [Sphaeroforma arctica JP610]|eukprot:XP_014156244.1 hypothetical protein SARC_05381 [Sphaeroforma arctica JP610]